MRWRLLSPRFTMSFLVQHGFPWQSLNVFFIASAQWWSLDSFLGEGVLFLSVTSKK